MFTIKSIFTSGQCTVKAAVEVAGETTLPHLQEAGGNKVWDARRSRCDGGAVKRDVYCKSPAARGAIQIANTIDRPPLDLWFGCGGIWRASETAGEGVALELSPCRPWARH